ncbi:MAG TPA: helix-turn-helix domain-containing protein [Steroidobacteraceae bacterium]|nr:helix-turn-helix domain-containing protein [Steroidobacteraceae bacterium]
MTVPREEWIALLWQLEGGKGEPRGNDRKRLLRRLRTMSRVQRKPPDPAATTQDSQSRMMRWLEAVFHNAGKPEVLAGLKKVPIGHRYARLPKPWRGKAGNQAKTAKGSERRAQALGLRDRGLSQTKIAAELGITERQVRRYLTGR